MSTVVCTKTDMVWKLRKVRFNRQCRHRIDSKCWWLEELAFLLAFKFGHRDSPKFFEVSLEWKHTITSDAKFGDCNHFWLSKFRRATRKSDLYELNAHSLYSEVSRSSSRTNLLIPFRLRTNERRPILRCFRFLRQTAKRKSMRRPPERSAASGRKSKFKLEPDWSCHSKC